MRSRNWSIRSKIVALIAVPLAALLALWVFATTLTAGPALNLLSAKTLLDTVGNPGEVLIGELQHERKLSVAYLANPDASQSALTDQRRVTDRAAADFRRSASSEDAQRAASPILRARISQMLTDLDSLPDNRAHIDKREVDVVGAQGLYNTVVDAGYQTFSATARVGDEQIAREYRALTTVGLGQEYLSRADSLMTAATTDGTFSEDVRAQLIQAIGTAGFLLDDGVTDLPEQDRAAYAKLTAGPAFVALDGLQNKIVAKGRAGSPPPVSAQEWQPVYDTAAQDLRAFQQNATAALTKRAQPVGFNILVRLGVAGIVGLIALVISIIVSVNVGRSIADRLVRLRGEALQMADLRLPAVVRRLRRGEVVDVRAETPPLEYGSDEIGELGRAFNEVQRTAVQSAVEEAAVRRGINEVFLNIARRSQTLLHRQLALLDRMERRETKPDELEDLYRIDHLATRMRRHAEDLVILAGAAPGRGWRNPVPVIDVIRGAISEVEDYRRIDIRTVETSAVLGRAVGDIIHLLAELLENAASFSPPHTRVVVAGQVLPNGYAIEIEDRGLGMNPEAMIEANRRLLEPPEFDPANSARLGLFVVAQLAHRHGILISLRPSAFGGVTAIVLIPAEIVTVSTGPMALPAGPVTAGVAGNSPANAGREWERPMVGTGTGVPARNSRVVQWQGGAVPLPARVMSVEDDALTETPATAGPADSRGPLPSEVAESLSPEGLIQRRRSAPRREPRPQGDHSRPRDLADAAAALAGKPPPAAPTSPAPKGRPAALDLSTPDGLPRRVRQASLAPQLRQPVEEQEDTVPLRTPEEIRDLMSALQEGTTRGRIAARTVNPESSGADVRGEASTVIFPVMHNRSESMRRDDSTHANGPDKDR